MRKKWSKAIFPSHSIITSRVFYSVIKYEKIDRFMLNNLHERQSYRSLIIKI